MSTQTSAPVDARRPFAIVLPLAVPFERSRDASHPSLSGLNGIAKRSIDIAGALAGLILLAPVLLLVAIAIKLDSPGPVIFRQRRVGLDGRRFDIYKFRSMAADAEERRAELAPFNEVTDGPIFKMAKDPRITRVGRLIRRTSLDEFPQLINVLLGQMSLVGPRPPLPAEVARYGPADRDRLRVLPGCTGLWQVSGRSDLASFKTMVQLDLEYIRAWSHRLDLVIILKTMRTILFMEGSC